MSNDVKNGALNFVKGLGAVVGVIGLAAISVVGEGVKIEEERKNSDNFKDVMTAIVSSDISSYYQKEIIQKIANKDLTQRQQESIIAICGAEMSGYYKYETILKIVE